MHSDATTRFSSRVEDYERYRPSYPREVAALAARECGLMPGAAVADIGCGPGFLARLFLDTGCEVFGVEPNAEMRQAGERTMGAYPRFHPVAGRAEATGLADGSVDLVTAGQAFHWFEPEAARAEFRRILKPGGWAMLVWNERRPDAGFMEEYNRTIAQYAPETSRIERETIADFFRGAEWRETKFANAQELDQAGLRGRVASSSYAPQRGTAEFAVLMEALDRLFERHQHDGKVTVLYETLVFYGMWR